MKKKTINAVITKKINEWLDSIENKDLAKEIKNEIVVTGGCITSMLLNEEVNDFDVYIKSKPALIKLCNHYCEKFNAKHKDKSNHIGRPMHAWVLDGADVEAWKNGQKKLNEFTYNYAHVPYSEVKGWTYSETDPNYVAMKNVSGMVLNTPPDRVKVMINSDGIAEDSDAKADKVEYNIESYLEAVNDADGLPAEDSKIERYTPVFLSTNAITLSSKLQIIVRFWGEPKEIHSNYDFVHATNYWTYQEGCVLNQPALEAILNKELVYVGSKYPICSLVRTRKFIKRGWQINAGQYVKMSFQVSKLDLTNIYVLEDQLVGVDSIYFLNFIRALKEKQLKEPNFTLDQQYLTTVIDRIFG